MGTRRVQGGKGPADAVLQKKKKKKQGEKGIAVLRWGWGREKGL
jgi:hypothetical protein